MIFRFGKKGMVIIVLAFFSCYLYAALVSDSLNITIAEFGKMGLNTNILYSLSTVATVLGIICSILFGNLMSVKSVRFSWGLSLLLTGAFSAVWSQARTVPVYAVGYLGCYCMTVVSSVLLGFQIIANWFPHKRGAAIGIVTVGFPLSAATTSALCNTFVEKWNLSIFYICMAVISFAVGLCIIIYVRDFPEEKGAYPDNDQEYDFQTAKIEHEENLRYLKTSEWTVKKCLKTKRMWVMWLAVSITGFLSTGIMANFVGKFMETGYEKKEILFMLVIAGVAAMPGSVFLGWIDTKFGTKKAGIIVNILSITAVAFNLLPIGILHYCSLPILGCMLGGSSNMLVSCTSAIWGRYDFKNAFRVVQPLKSMLNGVGITVVGIVGTNFSYKAAYVLMLFLGFVGLILMCLLKMDPIDSNVR